MLCSNNISKNTVRVYHLDDVEFKPTKRILSVNLNQWNKNIPKSLKECSIQTIRDNWTENPIVNELPLLSDIMALLDSLPTDLPLHLTIINIAYDCYWLRCYKQRWPKKPPPGRNFSEVENLLQDKVAVGSSRKSIESEEGISAANFKICRSDDGKKSWKELYLEMHVREFLENLQPENYDPEEIKDITSLCKNYVSCLTITEMKTPTKTDVPDHIPLHGILCGLTGLTELSLCFKQTYVGEKFSWHIFNTTMTDIKNLAKGLEQAKLQILRIQNSDINCLKVKLLLKGLLKNERLKEMEFSHCKISDHGAMAIAKFIKEHENLHHLTLINNFIGANGAKSLAYVLASNCKLTSLNLRLNMLHSDGGRYLNWSLVEGGKYLRNLTLAGCGLVKINTEIEAMLRFNKYLERLDISNNRLGEDIGRRILKSLEDNRRLRYFDVRRCNFTPDTEWEILNVITKNKNLRDLKVAEDSFPDRTEGMDAYGVFSNDFIEEFESILNE